MRLKLALRNTFRNRRRTFLSLFMIAGGVSSIIIFEGFARNLLLGLRETTINTDSGHLQIASSLYWNKTAKKPKQNLLADYQRVLKELQKDPRVSFVSGRITFFGLLSKNEHSVSARGVSFDPLKEKRRAASFRFVRGRRLDPKNPYQIAVGIGLAQKMDLKPGNRLTVLGYTYEGAVNAIDVEVSGVFQTAISEFDDATFLIPLKAAQTLLDTKSVEQVIVGLKHTEDTSRLRWEIQTRLGLGIGVKAWWEVAKLYTQVASFNRVQNRIVEFIILSLILLGILNTIGMSIFERTGEIGTIRALGEQGGSVIAQFVLEGAVLGAVGALVGVFLGVGIGSGINWLKIPLVMPGANTFLTIKIDLFWQSFVDSFCLAVVASVVAAVIPAIRASRMNIATALRHNV